MNRILAWSIEGALVAGVTGLVVVNAEQRAGVVFIPGDKPVTEDQIRTKLQSDGWSDVQIKRGGRYFEVTANKQGAAEKLAVDAQTGRLRPDDDDDDDD